MVTYHLIVFGYILYPVATFFLLRAFFRQRKKRKHWQARLEEQQQKASQLEQLHQYKSRFYTNITHEFRTPLTVIMGVADQIGNEKAKNLILRNSHQLLTMVNQLLDLSKLESHNQSVDWVNSNVITYLEYIVESCRPMAEGKRLNLAFFAQKEHLEMDFDEHKLQQILINLLSNAIKFTPEYGQIKVSASPVFIETHAYLELKVRDTGRGIAEEKLEVIFNRFYQIDDQQKGYGIGLALVREWVQLLGGHLEVASTPGKGTCFSVFLPIAQKSAGKQPSSLTIPEIENSGTETEAFQPMAAPNNDQPKVLIIEDHADVADYIRHCLSPTYKIQTASDGEAGLQKALATLPDVILCDVMMPKVNGFDVCQQLKAHRHTGHIPIILLTAKASQEDKITGLVNGADAFITKPFDKKELLVRLEKLADVSQRLRQKLAEPDLATTPLDTMEEQEVEFLRAVHLQLEDNLQNEAFNTHFLCRAIGVSRTQLHRRLKAITGLSTANYIRSYRLQKAKNLLETTDHPIGEIALEVGYKDFSHFSRSFHREFGIKPSETRK